MSVQYFHVDEVVSSLPDLASFCAVIFFPIEEINANKDKTTLQNPQGETTSGVNAIVGPNTGVSGSEKSDPSNLAASLTQLPPAASV